MNKSGINILAAIAILVLMPQMATAQISGQIGAYDHLPQRVYANPALRPSGRLNIGIPMLSHIYAEQSNNWLRPDELIRIDQTGRATVDFEGLVGGLGSEAFTGFGSSMELLHAGVLLGNHYLHVRMAERVQGGMGIPRDFFALALHGNMGPNGFDNHTANLGGFRVDMVHFREMAIGWNYNWGDKWGVGLTAKYLYGMETVRTTQSSLQMRTDPLTYAMTTSGAIEVSTSGIGLGANDEDVRKDVGRYLFGLRNRGFGLDVGGVYQPTKKLKFEFSANDLGFIRWRDDVATIGTSSADFVFSGIDFTNFLFQTGSDFDNALQDELDRLAQSAEDTFLPEGSYGSFRTAMFGYLRYAASYEVYKAGPLSGLIYANVMHAFGHRNLPLRSSLGYQQRLGKVLQAGLHYSYQVDGGGFLGGGITVNGGPFQFFCMVENFRAFGLNRYTIVDSERPGEKTTFVLPRHGADLRMHLGFNLTFGRKEVSRNAARPMMGRM